MQLLNSHGRLHGLLLYGAYGWLLLSAFLHFGIDVVSQYVRGKRPPSAATTLYFGLNSTYAVSQVLFAALALLAIRQGMTLMDRWPGIMLGFVAACTWFVLSWLFLEYSQPRLAVLLFAVLLWRSRAHSLMLGIRNSRASLQEPGGSHETRRKNDSHHGRYQRNRL